MNKEPQGTHQRDADHQFYEARIAEAVKAELKAIQDLYQTIGGDIVIPADDWKVRKDAIEAR